MRSWTCIALFLITIAASGQTEHNMLWENLIGVETDYVNQTLEKTATSGWGNGGAFSNNTLKAGENGYIYYIVENEVGFKSFGFSTDDPDAYQTTIEYGFYFDLNRLYILEDGVYVGQYSQPAVGDTLKIHRFNNSMNYYHNDMNYRRANCNGNTDMHIDLAMYHSGLHFNGAKASFGHDLIVVESFL